MIFLNCSFSPALLCIFHACEPLLTCSLQAVIHIPCQLSLFQLIVLPSPVQWLGWGRPWSERLPWQHTLLPSDYISLICNKFNGVAVVTSTTAGIFRDLIVAQPSKARLLFWSDRRMNEWCSDSSETVCNLKFQQHYATFTKNFTVGAILSLFSF